MMIGYRGQHCHVRYYMLEKSGKWRFKVWSLSDSFLKCVYFSKIYFGQTGGIQEYRHGQV